MKRDLRSLIAVVLAAVLLVGVLPSEGALAEEDGYRVSGDFAYEIREDGTLWIREYRGNQRKVTFPAELDGYRVFGISLDNSDEVAFTAAILSEGIEEIGDFGFSRCPGLKSVSLPQSLKKLGTDAFYRCESLRSVELPAGLEEMTDNPFEDCLGLKAIRVSEDNPWYRVENNLLIDGQEHAVISCAAGGLDARVEIPEGIERIGVLAFDEVSVMTQVILPESLRSIGNCAFCDCHSLEKVDFAGSSLELIEGYAFSGCGNLRSIQLPEGLKTLGDCAFSQCEALASVAIPDSLTEMDDNPFEGCPALADIRLSDHHPAFSLSGSMLVDREWGVLISYLNASHESEVALPEEITEIGEAAFAYNRDLVSVTIPSSVRVIRERAFSQCRQLKTVSIAEGLIRIETWAFSNCYELAEIHLPQSLGTIQQLAFSNCQKLTALDLPAGVTELQRDAFPSNEDLELTVHSDAAERFCQENGIAYIRGEDPAQAEGTSFMMYDQQAFVHADLEPFAAQRGDLLTEDFAIRQMLYRGIPLKAYDQRMMDGIPCLVLSLGDGKQVVLEEYLVWETGIRYMEEEDLILLCEMLFDETYDYYLEEPGDIDDDLSLEEVMALTAEIRAANMSLMLSRGTENLVPYGDGENLYTVAGMEPAAGQSRRLITSDHVWEWLGARGISHRSGAETEYRGAKWYVITLEEGENGWAFPSRRVYGERDCFFSEQCLYTFAAHFQPQADAFQVPLKDSEDFHPIAAEVLVVRGSRMEVAYERLTARENEPFRVRVTLLDRPAYNDGMTAEWKYQLRPGNSVEELEGTFGSGESYTLKQRTTILQTVPSPAYACYLSFGAYNYNSATLRVENTGELPRIWVGREAPYFAVANEPYSVRYEVDGKQYGITEMRMNWTVRYVEAEYNDVAFREDILTEPAGQLSMVPTADMVRVDAELTVVFDSEITYTREIGGYSDVGGGSYEPGIIRLRMDQDELKVGEDAVVYYEIENLEDLSGLEYSTYLYPEGWMAYDDIISTYYDVRVKRSS